MKRQIGMGALLSYVNIALNMVVSFFFTPFLLKCMGSSEYGVYQIISSFAGQLGIMTFGVSSLITRFIVFYNTKNEQEEKENFLFMAYFITCVLAAFVVVLGIGLYLSIDSLYAGSLSNQELLLAKQLFFISVVNIALTIINDSQLGVIRAHERFIVSYGINTVKLILRVLFISILLLGGYKAVAVVSVDALLTLLVCLFTATYSRCILSERARFRKWDISLLKQCFLFSVAVFMQAIVNQVNRNVDNVILGAMQGTSVVTVYSLGLTLYNVFISVITIFSGMYGPKATKLVAQDADGEQLTEFVITPAKIEATIAFLAISGFVLVGQEFIAMWLGDEFQDVYKVTLVLIIPAVLTVIQSITNNILDAKLKRMQLSVIILCMCIVNIVTSIILVRYVGYIGAAIGTAISTIVGDGFLMSYYLHRTLQLRMGRIYKRVFGGPVCSCVLCVVIGQIFRFLPVNTICFIFKGMVVVVLYAVLFYAVGLDEQEQSVIWNKIKDILGENRGGRK